MRVVIVVIILAVFILGILAINSSDKGWIMPETPEIDIQDIEIPETGG